MTRKSSGMRQVTTQEWLDERGRAAHVENVLAGKTCGNCMHRCPVVFDSGTSGRPARRGLVCGRDAYEQPVVAAHHTCEHWHPFSFTDWLKEYAAGRLR